MVVRAMIFFESHSGIWKVNYYVLETMQVVYQSYVQISCQSNLSVILDDNFLGFYDPFLVFVWELPVLFAMPLEKYAESIGHLR